MPGKVYLGGAGPGDPRLITLRLQEILESADAVLYDRLVNPALLNRAKPGCRLVDVGKRLGEQGLRQSSINRQIVAWAKKVPVVLRLKGGDPMTFARSGEETEVLRKHGIEYEIIPGISSVNGMAAWAEMPITQRGFSSSFAVATARPARGFKFENLTVPRADTVIYLMGMENIPALVEKLLRSGYRPDTPAAVVQEAATARQKRCAATLATLDAEVKKHGLASPALIVLGKIARLAPRCSWAEKLPLFGKTLVLTRPRGQLEKTASALRELGAEVLELPAVEIVPLKIAGFFEKKEALSKYTDLVFTSRSGVELFFASLLENGLDARRLAGKKIYAIGPQTARALESYGIKPDGLPGVFSSEGLVKLLEPEKLKGRFFLLPRAREADPKLEEFLKKAGAKIKKLALYRLAAPRPYCDLKTADGVIFTSSLGVKNFLKQQTLPPGAAVFCLGEKTRNAAREMGMKNPLRADSATSESLVRKIGEYFQKEPR